MTATQPAPVSRQGGDIGVKRFYSPTFGSAVRELICDPARHRVDIVGVAVGRKPISQSLRRRPRPRRITRLHALLGHIAVQFLPDGDHGPCHLPDQRQRGALPVRVVSGSGDAIVFVHRLARQPLHRGVPSWLQVLGNDVEPRAFRVGDAALHPPRLRLPLFYRGVSLGVLAGAVWVPAGGLYLFPHPSHLDDRTGAGHGEVFRIQRPP